MNQVRVKSLQFLISSDLAFFATARIPSSLEMTSRINFLLGHESRENMIIRLPQQVGQAEFFEEPIKEWIQKIVAGFHIGRPGIRPAQGLECNGYFLDAVTHGLHASVSFSATEQIVRLVMPGIGEQDGFLTEIIFDFALLPHGFS